ncbi:UNVERIFIED_CONTAM: recombinase family protein, partial [Escherichia coli]
MSRIFAYCRISTLDQTTENQRREIESAGFKIKPQQIIEEHISGSAATSERPGFNRLLARLKCGDQLIVTKLGNDSNLLIVFYVQIMPDDFVMQLHR